MLHSGDTIGKVEKAQRWPSSELADRCDVALRTDGALARLWPLTSRELSPVRADGTAETGRQPHDATDTDGKIGDRDPTDEPMLRRDLWPLAVAALAEAAVPTLGLSLLRHLAGQSLGDADTLAEQLRGRLITHALNRTEPTLTLDEVEAGVAAVHAAYQRASYTAAAKALPSVLDAAVSWARTLTGQDQIRANLALAAGNIAASKLAGKLGDHGLAWVCADRAAAAGTLANEPALVAVAAYQTGCSMLRMPGRLGDAENVVMSAAEDLATTRRPASAAACSARGSLLLLAAIIAARSGNHPEAARRLDAAEQLADEVRTDGNHLWTGFGPTNVRIHRVSAAVDACRPDHAIAIGERLDTTALPHPLVGRRTQVHLDLAAALVQRPGGDQPALLHLMEADGSPQKPYGSTTPADRSWPP